MGSHDVTLFMFQIVNSLVVMCELSNNSSETIMKSRNSFTISQDKGRKKGKLLLFKQGCLGCCGI